MAILWIRRDVRTQDNPALNAAIGQQSTIAVFISTPEQWRQHDQSPLKIDLLRRHLNQYAKQLASLGIRLVHLSAKTYADQVQVLRGFCEQNNDDTVLANAELELDEQRRDNAVINSGIDLQLFSGDTIVSPGEVLNKQQQMFKVFTPFKKAWLKVVNYQGIVCDGLPSAQLPPIDIDDAASVITADDFGYAQQDSSAWPLSETVIERVIPLFFEHKLANYSQNRDFPSVKGTSGLSPYLAIGAISPSWLVTQLIQRDIDVLTDPSHSHFSWLNELIWRDFYKHLLVFYPNLIKGESFLAQYRHTVWPGSDVHFKAWCEAKTGYPIVDAAMRQLNQTGWMHNRLRMVVASFLSKHLLVDWHLGERYFMQQLIDGDFSANNGGWQWAASTGCDAQPYFRIFNPLLQSKKFDPNGHFIRKYLPELENVPDKAIHFPHDYLASQGMSHVYVKPIVEHKQARSRALSFYKNA
ncbi:deoxyribodipyrimidine photo-lyase [Shewanella waksmanii]|uniref:deoxyribodipyrimidine photo-lyase n=1 Tax=Shewanella waksmanii TaxID=213783 RepID=UPI00373566A0